MITKKYFLRTVAHCDEGHCMGSWVRPKTALTKKMIDGKI